MIGLGMGWWVIAAVLSLPVVVGRGKYLLHMAQLEGYRPERYLRWMKRMPSALWERWAAAVWVIGLLVGLLVPGDVVGGIVWVAFAVAVSALALRGVRLPAKKPLVWTSRAKRLYACFLGLNLVLGLISAMVGPRFGLPVLGFMLWTEPLWMMVATGLMSPVERRINNRFLRAAREKLAQRPDLIIVGITGSYGKTSTKFILGTLLTQKFNVLVTPDSYNTPMGVCRVVNERLKPEHEVFVVEMGARQPGDIRELADLVHPKIGVLTAVGPVHLETFGSVEAVARTKYELIKSLPPDGLAVMNYDNPYCRELAKETRHVQVEGYGLENPGTRLFVSDVHVSEKGTTFVLADRETGESVSCRTDLLGRHQVLNILGAVSVARHLGLSLRQIAAGIGQLQPVPHRLQLIRSGGVYVIDDAFNANPTGTEVALEVLSGFSGRKVVVTPGMVELGGEEERYNREFGQRMAQVCDHVILVGPERTKPIAAGLLDGGLPRDRVSVVTSLEEATAVLQQLLRPGDAVLFENDLPDNYTR
ncbi:UDP-N-acetylmuramoyl-tripeptide--D-alanyl-D-alanine ligase [Kyrpidia spormannii]|uniref:UDP-N-acetylmuramoyl-tripeptide--D-alanyl-D-alanine ligase n=2 Tax=Kyrpidia spormannii TaxID=2055160 RepID=A0A2K8N7V3_9BACL|nr:UDP-N-acetylmuramoyl-tripeptide--D-alanyl-D-alanine ligase [Kyrpidia spormannii]